MKDMFVLFSKHFDKSAYAGNEQKIMMRLNNGYCEERGDRDTAVKLVPILEILPTKEICMNLQSIESKATREVLLREVRDSTHDGKPLIVDFIRSLGHSLLFVFGRAGMAVGMT
jgi:hypothetical protein